MHQHKRNPVPQRILLFGGKAAVLVCLRDGAASCNKDERKNRHEEGGQRGAECRWRNAGTFACVRARRMSVSIHTRTDRYPMRLASAHEALPSCSQVRLRNNKVRAATGAAMEALLQVMVSMPNARSGSQATVALIADSGWQIADGECWSEAETPIPRGLIAE